MAEEQKMATASMYSLPPVTILKHCDKEHNGSDVLQVLTERLPVDKAVIEGNGY